MVDTIIQYESAPLSPPFSAGALLLDAAANVPYEGLWVPTKLLKNSTIEIAGSMSSMSLGLFGTNTDTVGGVNQYNITIGGTITNNDVLTATFLNPNFPSGSQIATVNIATGNTTSVIAAALAAAINVSPALNALGYYATVNGSVVTVTFPSFPPSSNPNSTSSPAFLNSTRITTSVSGAATETATVTVGTNGTQIGSAITALGFITPAVAVTRYLKARLTTLTGTNANITVALQGVG